MKRKKTIIIAVSVVLCLLIGVAGGVRWLRWRYAEYGECLTCLVWTSQDIHYYYVVRGNLLMHDSEIDFPICPPSAVNMSDVSSDYPKTTVSWRAAYASRTIIHGTFLYPSIAWHYDEPWNSEHNIHQWNPQFCWGKRPAVGSERPEDFWTNVMGITGPDTAFELQTLKKLDGCGHLIFAVSVKNSGVHWAEPGDLDIHNLPADFREGIDGKGIYVLFLDGTIWFIRKDVPMELLENFLTASRARNSNRYDKLIRYAKELYHGGHFPSYADRCKEYERDQKIGKERQKEEATRKKKEEAAKNTAEPPAAPPETK